MQVSNTFSQFSDAMSSQIIANQQNNRVAEERFNSDRVQMLKEVGKTPAEVVIDIKNEEIETKLGKNVDLFV
jgi:hypothetical protein